MVSSGKPRWRKILYAEQPYPDNFSGPEFLQELRKNVTAETYTFWEAFKGACVLVSQVDVVMVYCLVFAAVGAGHISWTTVLVGCASAASVGYLVFSSVCYGTNGVLTKSHLKPLLAFFAFGYGLSPVLRTLTETVSTDTIYAMATMMFLLSLVFHDYGVDAPIVSASLSCNLSIFAAVCLISRLPSSNHAFALLTLAVLLFAQWPVLRKAIVSRRTGQMATSQPAMQSRIHTGADMHRQHPEQLGNFDVYLCCFLCPVTVVGCFLIFSSTSAVLHALMHAFLCFGCPMLLLQMQPLKSTIHGPWDEAIIKDS